MARPSNRDIILAPVTLSPTWGATCGAYPRLTRLSDGGLVGSLTTWQNGQQYLRVTRAKSEDYQCVPPLAFADIGTITQGCGDIDNCHMLQLSQIATGEDEPRLLAAFRNHNERGSGPTQMYRITVCRSDNGGKDWVYHSEPSCTRPPHGLWEPFLFDAADGSLQVYYARENPDGSQNVVMQRSGDGGLTWETPSPVAPQQCWLRDGMPGVTTYYDGHQAAAFIVFESSAGGAFCVMGAKSVDSGSTWIQRAPVYTTPNGRSAGAPQVVTIDGRLVVVFMTDEDAATPQWTKHARIKAMVSTRCTPDGITWSQPVALTPPESYWPGCYGGNDGNTLLVTYNNLVAALPLDCIAPDDQQHA